MLKYFLALSVLATGAPAFAQQQTAPANRAGSAGRATGALCPRGTTYAMIRHSLVKPGKWAEFEKAVAAHTAWYAGKGSRTATTTVRVVDPRGSAGLSTREVVTVTRYVGAQPQRDAGYAAFTQRYKDSATIRDEARVCLSAL